MLLARSLLFPGTVFVIRDYYEHAHAPSDGPDLDPPPTFPAAPAHNAHGTRDEGTRAARPRAYAKAA